VDEPGQVGAKLKPMIAQSLQGFFGFAPSAQDHEIISVGQSLNVFG